MLEAFYRDHKKLVALKENYLFDILEEMATIYHGWKFTIPIGQKRLRPAELFGNWLEKRAIPIKEVSKQHAEQFIAEVSPPKNKTRIPGKASDFSFCAGVNRAVELIQIKYPRKARLLPIDREIARYQEHLEKQRGLSKTTIRNRGYFLRIFIRHLFGNGSVKLSKITPNVVHDFFSNECNQYDSLTTQQYVAGTLRDYFKYRLYLGTSPSLYNRMLWSIPKIRGMRRGLSQTILDPESIKRILDSTPCDTNNGTRDFAVLCCLRDLGMRGGDVANLTLDDLNWKDGLIRTQNGKGFSPVWLPLPERVGKALADYIRHSRPRSESRHIFLRHVAPVGIAGTAAMIRGIVIRAFGRAGLSDIHTGMHSFRHTAATQMRRHGEDLKAIADVIGHRSIQTTKLYAQVDTPALQAVAQPWPEDVQ